MRPRGLEQTLERSSARLRSSAGGAEQHAKLDISPEPGRGKARRKCGIRTDERSGVAFQKPQAIDWRIVDEIDSGSPVHAKCGRDVSRTCARAFGELHVRKRLPPGTPYVLARKRV